MPNGIVRWFSDKKGFGFIEAEGGGKVFVHYSEIKIEDRISLFPGDKVQYEVKKDEFGTHAVNVRLVSSE